MEAMEDQYRQLVKEGVAALTVGNTSLALRNFEQASELDECPELLSHLGYCLAKEKKNYDRAISLCKNAISDEHWNSVHYLNLGRIYLLAGRKQDALRTFRDGLLHENNPRLQEELARLGNRKYPVIASLPRDHRLNRVLGKLFTKLKIR
jgi:tetratricopeptide (TPR) repeat protein